MSNEYVRGQRPHSGHREFLVVPQADSDWNLRGSRAVPSGRYVDEQVFRFNNRKGKNDEQRFAKVLSQVAGKRLTYAEVTGKVGETAF